MIKKINEDDLTRKILAKTRYLREEFENGKEGTENVGKSEIVIDIKDDTFVDLTNSIRKFVGALKIDSNAQIVYPKENDVVFNGVITDMNNLKFQFKYNDQSGGLYIWADSMLLTRNVSEKIAKLVVLREQWKDYWASTMSQYTNNEN